MVFLLSVNAQKVLDGWASRIGTFQKKHQEIKQKIQDKSLFSEEQLKDINSHLENMLEQKVRDVYAQALKDEEIRLAGRLFYKRLLYFTGTVGYAILFLFCTGPFAMCLGAMGLCKFVSDRYAKNPLMVFAMFYGFFLTLYTTSLGKFLYEWVLIPLFRGACYLVSPFTDFFKGVVKYVSSAYSKAVEYFAANPKEDKEGHGTNSSNTTTARNCSQSAGFSCDLKDFLDSVGGFSGMGMMFGLVTKMALAMDGTYLVGYGPDNTSSLLSSHALLPGVIQQQMFHHNLARDIHLTPRVPLDLNAIGSKFEAQVKKAIEDERKKVATMIADAINEERKKVEEEKIKNRNSYFYQGVMTVGFNVAWEIGKHVLFNVGRQYRDNNRAHVFYQIARAVLSAVPVVYHAYAPLVAREPVRVVAENVLNGGAWSAVAFQVIHYVGKFIYDYALVPPIVHVTDEPEVGNPRAAGGATRAGQEAAKRAGAHGNVQTLVQ